MCCNQNENTRGCFGCCGSSENGVFINPIPRYIVGPIGPVGPQGPQGEQGEPGVVTPAAAVADAVATVSTPASNAAKINEILAALRAAGLMET